MTDVCLLDIVLLIISPPILSGGADSDLLFFSFFFYWRFGLYLRNKGNEQHIVVGATALHA